MLGLILWTALNAQAHIMGSSTWCLANSPVHFECQFEDRDLCVEAAQKKSKSTFERWECVPYPIDLRNIPKSGESPLPAPTSTTIPPKQH